MNFLPRSRGLALMLLICGGSCGFSKGDPGKEEIGQLEVTVYFATDGDPSVAGQKATGVSEAIRMRLQTENKLSFSHYRTLGVETKPILRSYENWAQPLTPSDEVLVRFETRSQPAAGLISLDLDLWLARKKILKTHAPLSPGRPLYVLGPEWRGGRLIIAVALAP